MTNSRNANKNGKQSKPKKKSNHKKKAKKTATGVDLRQNYVFYHHAVAFQKEYPTSDLYDSLTEPMPRTRSRQRPRVVAELVPLLPMPMMVLPTSPFLHPYHSKYSDSSGATHRANIPLGTAACLGIPPDNASETAKLSDADAGVVGIHGDATTAVVTSNSEAAMPASIPPEEPDDSGFCSYDEEEGKQGEASRAKGNIHSESELSESGRGPIRPPMRKREWPQECDGSIEPAKKPRESSNARSMKGPPMQTPSAVGAAVAPCDVAAVAAAALASMLQQQEREFRAQHRTHSRGTVVIHFDWSIQTKVNSFVRRHDVKVVIGFIASKKLCPVGWGDMSQCFIGFVIGTTREPVLHLEQFKHLDLAFYWFSIMSQQSHMKETKRIFCSRQHAMPIKLLLLPMMMIMTKVRVFGIGTRFQHV